MNPDTLPFRGRAEYNVETAKHSGEARDVALLAEDLLFARDSDHEQWEYSTSADGITSLRSFEYVDSTGPDETALDYKRIHIEHTLERRPVRVRSYVITIDYLPYVAQASEYIHSKPIRRTFSMELYEAGGVQGMVEAIDLTAETPKKEERPMTLYDYRDLRAELEALHAWQQATTTERIALAWS